MSGTLTLAPADLGLYAAALLALFLTPGPVWLALSARALSGGFHAAWPLAFGVVVGDVLWPLLAVLGMSWFVAELDGAMMVLRLVASGVFIVMGLLVLKNADRTIAGDSRLMRPGMWAGFLAGLAVILGNPKAILFYMGVLPGFFDLAGLTAADIAAICLLSALVPLLGNLILALFIHRARQLLTSPAALRRSNVVAGSLLLLVACVIPFT